MSYCQNSYAINVFLKHRRNHYIEIVKAHSGLEVEPSSLFDRSGIELGQHRDQDRTATVSGQDQDHRRGGIGIEAGLRSK
jgi:hypothetical protein